VREIKRVAFFQMGFNFRPKDHLRRIGNQILNNGGFLHRFFNREKRFAGNPAVGDGFVPIGFVFRRLSDNHVDAVVFHIESLRGTLNTIAQHGNHFLIKNFLRFFYGKLFRSHHIFHRAAKINFRHKTPFS